MGGNCWPEGPGLGANPGYTAGCFNGQPQWFIDGQLPADFWFTDALAWQPCCGTFPPQPASLPQNLFPPPGSVMSVQFTDGPAAYTGLNPSLWVPTIEGSWLGVAFTTLGRPTFTSSTPASSCGLEIADTRRTFLWMTQGAVLLLRIKRSLVLPHS